MKVGFRADFIFFIVLVRQYRGYGRRSLPQSAERNQIAVKAGDFLKSFDVFRVRRFDFNISIIISFDFRDFLIILTADANFNIFYPFLGVLIA